MSSPVLATITGYNDSAMWYADQVGKSFYVKHVYLDISEVLVRASDGYLNYVSLEFCTITNGVRR